ncbi:MULTISPECIES: efflux RND transporter permease subunit [unclassified Thioalkalivibrio]|uniref:efflux RND transporter permease subunit n=1 Tax=unclassified Thioalkalivibrio TaxID=2621013 RepID=UPI000379A579|nr:MULTISPECIES: efflux RND transporter permease subunit [unclassified Thioalkalivibrio]
MTWVEGLLRYRHTVLALLAAVLILGLQARFDLPVQLFPDTDPPTVTVITEYPGMAALDVDRELTRLLEEEFASLDGVTRISSSSQTGLSVARVEFDYGITSAFAAVDVQNAVGRLRPDLPATIEEPQILEFSTADKPIVTIALTSDILTLDAIREQADNAIRERLEWVPGVAAIDVVGGHKRELHVALDPERTEALGIDMPQVLEALDDWNLMAPGGRVRIGELESVVRFDAPLRSEADAREIILVADGDTRVRLGDIARVRLEPGEPRSAYRHDGQAAIAVQVLRRDDANTVEVAARVREALEPLRDATPELNIVVADDDSVFTEKVIADMTQTVMIAIALTMVIVLLFLADLRQAGIIALSIPAAFLATFGLMQLAGLDLNMVTMSALILAIGLLVDDGIVILENIHRHLDEEGHPPRQAAIQGVGEVFGAKLGGTLTTLGVLLPLAFMGGFIGELFRPLALTLAFALSASFLMAVTLIPLLATYWLRPANSTATPRWRETLEAPARGVRHLYLDVLTLALQRPLATLVVAVMLLALSLGMLRMTGSEMLPRFDSGSFQVLVDMAPGTRLETTLETLEPVERYLAEHEYVVDVSSQFGHEAGARSMGDRGAMGVNQAEITVTLVPRTQRPLTQWEIMDDVRQRLEATPGVTLAVPRELGGTARSSTAAPIIARIRGEQAQSLDRTASELLDHLAGIPGITDLYKDWALDTPEVRVRVDHDRAAELGLTGAGLARSVHQAMDGAVATRFRQPPKRDLDVVVRYQASDRRYPEDLEGILLPTREGPVALGEIASLEHTLGPRIVTRENGQRTLDILGFHLGRPLSEVVADVQQRLDTFTAPDGYPATLAGEQADFDEARDHMMRALLLAALAVYLLLVVQFRSFAHPVIIMTAIPLQFIGVVAALLIAGKYVSMPALLGIILLIGIVVNNSIILLDLARHRLAEGLDVYAAVTEAVETRMRPIMMTALSTIAGMLPLALEMAVGAERFSPIATVIIGGILAATLLTLVVIPALFVLLHRFGPELRTSRQAL